MTTAEINVAIAEACGWNQYVGLMKRGLWYRANANGYTAYEQEAGRYTLEEAKRHEYLLGDEPVTIVPFTPPDYCHDLNAMREAALTLSTVTFLDKDRFEWTQRCEFMCQLERIVMRDSKVDQCNFEFYNATSRQRAEAFLRALGKWEEANGGLAAENAESAEMGRIRRRYATRV